MNGLGSAGCTTYSSSSKSDKDRTQLEGFFPKTGSHCGHVVELFQLAGQNRGSIPGDDVIWGQGGEGRLQAGGQATRPPTGSVCGWQVRVAWTACWAGCHRAW